MTAVEWLLEELKKVHHPTEAMIMYAKKLEKQQIIDAYYGQSYSTSVSNGEQYYNETYGSKGSDETNVEEVPNPFLEGYEQINQDNLVTRGSTALVRVTSSQTEISDEEIEKAAAHHEPVVTRRAWISACKWYREQLKSK